jgi:hypothetical protein
LAELPALQKRALEIEGRLKELNKKLSEALNADPARGTNTAEMREAQTELAALKKDGKADTPEAMALASALARLAKEKALVQKAHLDPLISALDGEKRELLQQIFNLAVTKSAGGKPLVDAYRAATEESEKAHRALAEAQGKVLPSSDGAAFLLPGGNGDGTKSSSAYDAAMHGCGWPSTMTEGTVLLRLDVAGNRMWRSAFKASR